MILVVCLYSHFSYLSIQWLQLSTYTVTSVIYLCCDFSYLYQRPNGLLNNKATLRLLGACLQCRPSLALSSLCDILHCTVPLHLAKHHNCIGQWIHATVNILSFEWWESKIFSLTIRKVWNGMYVPGMTQYYWNAGQGWCVYLYICSKEARMRFNKTGLQQESLENARA